MTEILSPAGNKDTLIAAIDSGADAVYMGLKSFGARAGADNFTTEEYCDSLDYAHLYGKKLYLTLNTLIKEREFEEALNCIEPLYKSGLDGIIVQDIGLAKMIKSTYPDLAIHASTQMNVVHSLGANYLKELGITRIVPGRECSLKEVIDIKKYSGLEIETFIHGAMCYSYSGQCLFSAYLGGRSGNRGRCAGTCRLPYNNGIYPLSLKDMCTIEHIGALVDAGIDSFKIEGRLKSPLYVAGVTSIYRKYIDRHLRGETSVVSKEDMKDLAALYLRSKRCSGYYFQHNSADMVSLNNPAYGNDNQLLDDLSKKYLGEDNHKRIELDMKAYFKAGDQCSLVCSCGKADTKVLGPVIEASKKRPAAKEDIIKNLRKLGDTEFILRDIEVCLGEDCFVPVSVINNLRRDAIKELTSRMLLPFKRDDCIGQYTAPDKILPSAEEKSGIAVSIRTLEQLSEAINFDIGAIIVPGELITDGLIDLDKLKLNNTTRLIVALPRILRLRSIGYMDKLEGILLSDKVHGALVRNIEELQWVRDKVKQLELWGDYSLYSYNQFSLMQFKKDCKYMSAPLELNLQQLRDLKDKSIFVNVYGHAPLMVSANCLVKTLEECRPDNKNNYRILRDRMGKGHHVVTNCTHCYNEIFNAVPTSLHSNLLKLKDCGLNNWRMDFTVEDKETTKHVLQAYLCGGQIDLEETTTGLLNKGVL